MNDRIRIAEAMGWKAGRTDTVAVMGRPISHTRWIDPEGNDRAQCPNPFEDANDCEAVMRWLNEKGWWVEIHWQPDKDEFGELMAAGAYVHIWHRDSEVHSRKDYDRERWKECVCDIALKVIQE